MNQTNLTSVACAPLPVVRRTSEAPGLVHRFLYLFMGVTGCDRYLNDIGCSIYLHFLLVSDDYQVDTVD